MGKDGGIEGLLSETERQELHSLAEEGDAEIFFEGLFRLGKKLEAVDKLEAAVVFYSTVVGAVPPLAGDKREQPLRIRAQQQLYAIQGQGSFAPRFEFLLRHFTKDAGDPRMILPMLAGTTVYQLAKTATLGRLAATTRVAWWSRGPGARFAAASAGYAVEVPTFALSGRALRQLGVSPGQNPDLGHELAGAAVTLGVLKAFGFVANQALFKLHGLNEFGLATRARGAMQFTRAFSSQSAMFAGLLTAHAIEERVGLRPRVDGATTVTDTLAAMLSLGVGAHLGHRILGPRFAAFQKELGLRAKIYGDFEPPARGAFTAKSRLALAAGVRGPGLKFEGLSLAVGERGSGMKMDPEYAVREVERWLDHPRMDLAWKIFEFWGELEGQLRSEDFSRLAAKLYPRMDAKGTLPPRLAINMMKRLLPRLPPEQALPIFEKLEAKLSHPEAEIAEAALESLAGVAAHAPQEIVERILPILERLMDQDHPWLPTKAFQAAGASTPALPHSRRLAHLKHLAARMLELELDEGATIAKAAADVLSPLESASLARWFESRLFAEDTGAHGPLREALNQLVPLLGEENRADFLGRMKSRAEHPDGSLALAALEILGEWSGSFSPVELRSLIAWAAPRLYDPRLTQRMTAMNTIWRLVMSLPEADRLGQAGILEGALRDGSVEVRRTAVEAWGLLAQTLNPERQLELAKKLLAVHGDPEAEIRRAAWLQLVAIHRGLDSHQARRLLDLCLSQAPLENISMEILKDLSAKIPLGSLGKGLESPGFERYAAYRRADLPWDEFLWRAYLGAADPAEYLAKTAAELRTFRRGRAPDPRDLRQTRLAYAALEISENLDIEDFRRGLHGKKPPQPFIDTGFRAPVRGLVSLHTLLNKGRLLEALRPLEAVRDAVAFRKHLEAFIGARFTDLRSVKTLIKEVFPSGFENLEPPAWTVAAKALLPRLWQHRAVPAVRELIASFGLFLAWDRLGDSPLRKRLANFEAKRAASGELEVAMRAAEEFYRDTLGEALRELGLKAEEIPFFRRQRRALVEELGRAAQELGVKAEVEFLPSKSAADRFFAWVAEDCNEERQKAIFRGDFQLMRMVSGERLRGLIYLQEARLDGKKVLVLGLQPRSSWEVDHRDLLRVVEREFSRIGEEQGYDAVLLMADDNQQSNRRDMLEAIRERGYSKKTFKEEVSGAVFEGKEFLAMWKRSKASTRSRAPR